MCKRSAPPFSHNAQILPDRRVKSRVLLLVEKRQHSSRLSIRSAAMTRFIPSSASLRPLQGISLSLLLVATLYSAGPQVFGQERMDRPGVVHGQAPIVGAEAPCLGNVWLISARDVYCCCQRPPRLRFWRHTGCSWTPASLEEFLASDVPGMPTCFWIHGWRVSACDAMQEGWSVYRRLKGQSCGPFRFVIWSWPSEQTEGLLADARQKVHLADVGAYPLAWVVDQIDPRVPVSMVAFSLGARIATGALHLLGGGCLVGCRLDHRVHAERCPARAVLLAGALDNCSLAMNQRNGQALCQTDRMLVMVNDRDNVLNWYPLLCGWNGPEALGYTGAVGNLGPCCHAYEQLYVGHIVGRQHDWVPYFESCRLLAAISHTALFTDRGETAAPAAAAGNLRRRALPRRAAR
jgi:hypothetical protein